MEEDDVFAASCYPPLNGSLFKYPCMYTQSARQMLELSKKLGELAVFLLVYEMRVNRWNVRTRRRLTVHCLAH